MRNGDETKPLVLVDGEGSGNAADASSEIIPHHKTEQILAGRQFEFLLESKSAGGNFRPKL